MSFTASVLRVMIASPSDIPDARDAVEAAINNWNNANASNKQIVLLPWRWETSSVPVLGGHPQSLINSQGVDDSDVVFALFGSRLGSPTPDAVSGTVEEIQRAVDAGKPVHLYFSTAALPNDVDTRQLDGLREFRAEISQRGLLGEFATTAQLGHEVWKAIEYDISSLGLSGASPELSRPSGVDIRVQPQQEREVSGIDKKGAPRYKTKRWLDVANDGDQDAEQVSFEGITAAGLLRVIAPDQPVTLHKKTTRRLPIALSAGVQGAKLRVTWVDDEETRERTFDIY